MNNTPKSLRPQFLLNPDIVFLNHGSFGACPKPIFDEYQEWQRKLETRPVKFQAEEVFTHLENSRRALGEYINCDKDDLVYFPNPTHAISNLIPSLNLNERDEVLTTDQEYGACDRAWVYYAQKSGFKYIKSEIPLPITSVEEFCQQFWSKATPQTKYVYLSHITSSTALILPIDKIVKEAKVRRIKTIIDGAHVPGHIPLDIKAMDPDYYTGACHKWLCCPKGVSFLFVRKKLQEKMQPLVFSWGWGEKYNEFKASTQLHSESRFVNIFQWQGTRDMSAFLTVPASIEFQNQYDWDSVRSRCGEMVLDARNRITELTGLPKLCPDDWLGQMATILFPMDDTVAFKERLYDDHQIEISTMAHEGHTAFRISIQGYNSEADVDHLILTLKNLI